MTHGSDREDPWRQLSEAGRVKDADPGVFQSAYVSFLGGAGHGGTTRAASVKPYRGRLLVAATVAAIAAGFLVPAIVRAAGPAAERATAASSGPSPSMEPSPVAPTTTQNVGNATGSLVAYFGAPTFEAFTLTPYVAEVVEGTIEGATSRYLASGDDGSIITELKVRVTRAREGEAGETITVYEPGGVVAKREMKAELESKFGKLSEADLSGYVEERRNGQPPALVGDRVLLAIGSESDRPGPTVVARLTSVDGAYRWTTTPPNARWSVALEAAQVDRIFS